jgi:hypothetical protein
MKRALLFSGGLSPKQDKPRYRNNILAFYKLLVNVYGYSKEQIRICLSGGGAFDAARDGLDTPYFAATRAQFLEQAAWLSEAKEQDTIFFFASNHGEPDGLCLWKEDETITPGDIETSLAKCPATKVLLFAQCHAGIFGSIALDRAVICCACGDAEESLPVPHRKNEVPLYDEFVYHMLGALNGVYPDQAPLDTSVLPARATALYEACEYARRKDRTMKTPLFFPDPNSQAWAKTILL